jgi:hypothetical protein
MNVFQQLKYEFDLENMLYFQLMQKKIILLNLLIENYQLLDMHE